MTTINKQAVQSTDDCQRILATTPSYSTSYGNICGGAATATTYKVGAGMRFQNITIPKEAKIHSARLYLESVSNTQGNPGCMIKLSGEGTDNAAEFSATDDGTVFDQRYATHTSATVDWSIPYAYSGSTKAVSPELRTIVQEIVNRSGWSSGNSLVLFYEDFDNRSVMSPDFATRYWKGYDTSTTLCPELVIEYSYTPTAVNGSFYETNFEFQASGTGWQNYDLYTNANIPKGAVAHIVISNRNETSARIVGVRTDGSSLDRYIKLHEAENGGCVLTSMYVKVDSSTGYIETYVDTNTHVNFCVMGYWTGHDYTEKFTDITPGTASAWTDIDVYTNQSVPKGRVCDTLLVNLYDSNFYTIGVHTDGSALTTRYVPIHEAESSSSEYTDSTSFQMMVKSDATTGLIEGYTTSTTYGKIYLMGYFGSTMDYTEKIESVSLSNVGWDDWDLTSYLDADGRVVDILVAHYCQTGPMFHGARTNGSSLVRIFEIHENEESTSSCNGYCAPCGTDTNGIVETYSNNPTHDYFRLLGYYKPTNITTNSITKYSDSRFKTTNSLTPTSDARFKTSKNIIFSDNQPTGGSNYSSNITYSCGQRKTISGNIHTLGFSIKKGSTSVSGNVYVKIYRASDTYELYSAVLTDSANLTTEYQTFTHTFTTPFAVDDTVFICSYFVSNGTNYILTATSTTDVKPYEYRWCGGATSPETDTVYYLTLDTISSRAIFYGTISKTINSDARFKKLDNSLTKYSDALFSTTEVTNSFNKYSNSRYKVSTNLYYTTTDSQTSESAGVQFGTGTSVTRAGQRKTLSGLVKGITLSLSSPNDPITGSIWVQIRKVSDDSIITENYLCEASTLDILPTHHTVLFNEPIYINQEVRILAVGVDLSNYVQLIRSASDVKSGEMLTTYSGTYTDNSSYDAYYIVYYSYPFYSDTRFKATYSFNKYSDSRFRTTKQFTKFSDSRFKRTESYIRASDARFKYLGVQFTKTSDSRFRRTEIYTRTSDAKFKLLQSFNKTSDTKFYKQFNIGDPEIWYIDETVDYPRLWWEYPQKEIKSIFKYSDARFKTTASITPSSDARFKILGKTIELNGDARFKATGYVDITSDAKFLSMVAIEADSDARFKSSYSFDKLSDARFRITVDKTIYSDSRFKRTESAAIYSDANFVEIIPNSFTKYSDARFLRTETLSPNSDARFKTTKTTYTVSDALFKYVGSLTPQSDAIFKDTYFISTNADTRFRGTVDININSDSRFLSTNSVQSTSFAQFKIIQEQLIYSDSRFRDTYNIVTYSDAIFSSAYELHINSDARFIATKYIDSTSDARFLKTETDIIYSDAIFSGAQSIDIYSDARFAKYGIIQTKSSDTRFRTTLEISPTSDSRFLMAGIKYNYSSDVWFLKISELTINSTALFKRTQESVIYSDSKFKYEQINNINSDARFKGTYEISTKSDVNISSGFEIFIGSDAQFKKFGVIYNINSDARFRITISDYILSNSIFFGTNDISILSDARFQRTEDISSSSDANFLRTEEISTLSDTNFFDTYEQNINSDAKFLYNGSVDIYSDARYKDNYIIDIPSEAHFKIISSISKTSDARFSSFVGFFAISDACFKGTNSTSAISDTIFLRTESKIITSDNRFRISYSFQKTSDTKFKAVISLLYPSDVTYKGSNIININSSAFIQHESIRQEINLDGSIIYSHLVGEMNDRVMIDGQYAPIARITAYINPNIGLDGDMSMTIQLKGNISPIRRK